MIFVYILMSYVIVSIENVVVRSSFQRAAMLSCLLIKFIIERGCCVMAMNMTLA